MMIAHVTVPLIIYALLPANIKMPSVLLALLLGSGVPNFDVFPTLLREKTPKNTLAETHASTIFHTPFLYIVFLPILGFFFDWLGIPNGWTISVFFCLGSVVHVLMESFDEKGRRLLFPFSKKFYGIRVLPYDFWTYLTSTKILVLEGLIFTVACVLLLL